MELEEGQATTVTNRLLARVESPRGRKRYSNVFRDAR